MNDYKNSNLQFLGDYYTYYFDLILRFYFNAKF